MSTKLFPKTVRCIDCLHYNDRRKPFGCKYSGARVSLKAAKTRDIICDYYVDEKATVATARAGWRGHAAGVYGKKGRSQAKPGKTWTIEYMNGQVEKAANVTHHKRPNIYEIELLDGTTKNVPGETISYIAVRVSRAKIARNQRQKTYDVYHYDLWGAHHFVTEARNKEEIYESARSQGYKRSQVEAFERR